MYKIVVKDLCPICGIQMVHNHRMSKSPKSPNFFNCTECKIHTIKYFSEKMVYATYSHDRNNDIDMELDIELDTIGLTYYARLLFHSGTTNLIDNKINPFEYWMSAIMLD